MFIYDVCFHLDNYSEKQGVEFSNPVNVGDFISDGIGEGEYKVFQVVHSQVGGGSCIHVKHENVDF